MWVPNSIFLLPGCVNWYKLLNLSVPGSAGLENEDKQSSAPGAAAESSQSSLHLAQIKWLLNTA